MLLDQAINFRLDEELKSALAAGAKKARKTEAQFIREKLWPLVGKQEGRGSDSDVLDEILAGVNTLKGKLNVSTVCT